MVNTILGLIFSILYNIIVSPLFGVIDLLQAIFQGFAGVGTIMSGNDVITNVNNGEDKTTGIVYYLLRSGTVQNLFYALLTLAIVLLVLFTIVAFVKNIYAEKPKPWKDIITSSIKGLAGFFLTPILCLFGVWVGNILLQTLFEATSEGNSRTMSAEVFVAGAYNANRMRLLSAFDTNTYVNTLAIYYPNDSVVLKYIKGEQEVDADGNLLWEDEEKTIPKYKKAVITDSDKEHLAALADDLFRGGGSISTTTLNYNTLAIHDMAKITIFYESTQINYLLMIVGSIFMIYALGSISFGAVKRLFYLVFLFILSPLMNAMYPIDDGSAAKGLNKDFYKQTIGVYSAVVGLNLFYAILPLIVRVGYVDGLIGAAGNGLFSVIIMICGLLTVKELIGLIDGYIGSSGVYAAGTSMMASVKGQMSKYGKKAGKAVGEFGKVHAARKAAAERGESAASAGAKVFFGDIGKGLSKTMGDWTGINHDAWVGDWKKGSKEGLEAYRGISDKKDNKSKIKEIREAYDTDSAKAIDKYGVATAEEAIAELKSPYKKAARIAGEGVSATEDDKILKEIKDAIDTIKKTDDKDQKGLLETLKKTLEKQLDGKPEHSWYKKGMSAEDALTAVQHTVDIRTLKGKLDAASSDYQAYEQYGENQAKMAEIKKAHSSAKFDSDGRMKGTAKYVEEYNGLLKANAEIVADHGNLDFTGDVSIKEESARKLAITIGEQVQRALQNIESVTNSNEGLAGIADDIGVSVRKEMEKLEAKGGKKEDKQASTLETLSTNMKNQADALNALIKKLGNDKDKKGGGAT